MVCWTAAAASLIAVNGADKRKVDQDVDVIFARLISLRVYLYISFVWQRCS